MNYPTECPWHLIPRWRKVVGFLMFLGLWWTEEEIGRFMLQEHWPK